jgi:DNA-binding NarL/FixJ family response regulator
MTTNPAPTSDTPTSERIRVLVVDDHPAVRTGVRRLIEDQPDMVVIGEARDADEAVSEVLELAPVDVAVVDHQLGGERNGLWLTRRLKSGVPMRTDGAAAHASTAAEPAAPQVLVYSAFADEALAVAAIVAGADGLLSKRAVGAELCAVIRQLARGRPSLPVISPTVARAVGAQLAPREQAMLGMLLHRLPGPQIASALSIDEAELDRTRSRILRTLTAGPPPSAVAPTREHEEAEAHEPAAQRPAQRTDATSETEADDGRRANGVAVTLARRRRVVERRLAAARLARDRLPSAAPPALEGAGHRRSRYPRVWRRDRYVAR